MIRSLFVAALAIALVGVGLSQDSSAQVDVHKLLRPDTSLINDIDPASEVQYQIELKIIEASAGGGPPADEASDADEPPQVVRELRRMFLEKQNEAGTVTLSAVPAPHLEAAAAKPAPADVLPNPAAPQPAVPQPEIERTGVAPREGPDLWDEVESENLAPGMRVLAAPKLTVLAGKTAVIEVRNSQIFTYLVPLGENKFEAKQTPPHDLGMRIALAVRPDKREPDFVEIAPLEINITALDGREPMARLNLDVGKPVVSTRSLKTTATVELGDVRIVPIPSGPRQEAVLLVRVLRVSREPAEPMK